MEWRNTLVVLGCSDSYIFLDMKQKTVIFNGREALIKDLKKRRDQLDKGFVIGAFDQERHKKAWIELTEILEVLKNASK